MKKLLLIAVIFGAYYWYKQRSLSLSAGETINEPVLKSAWLLTSTIKPTNTTPSGNLSGSTPGRTPSQAAASGTATTGSYSESGGQVGGYTGGEVAYFSKSRNKSCFK